MRDIVSKVSLWRHRRAEVGAGLFVLAVLLAGLSIVDRTAKTAREGTSDGVERYEQRFIPLRRELPSGAILGYVSDSPADDDTRAYFMAQYALAPVVPRGTCEGGSSSSEISFRVESGTRSSVSRLSAPETRRTAGRIAVCLCLTLLGYFYVYLTGPYELNWWLKSSLDRLFMQLWPSVLFCVFLLLGPDSFSSLAHKQSIPKH